MQSDPSQDQSPTNGKAIPSAAATLGPHALETSTPSQQRNTKHPVRKSNQVCRFYGTKKGCRAQDQCPYRHVSKLSASTAGDYTEATESTISNADTNATAVAVTGSEASKTLHRGVAAPRKDRGPVAKPISALQQRSPREFQINQVIRRFTPAKEERTNATTLRLKLQPSDPDFPFELNALEITLTIPNTWPGAAEPSIRVENKDIPRGFQINVERGFDSLVSVSPTKTLLQLLNDLDRNLERFLTTEKAQTIKIVANRRKEEQQPAPIEANTPVPKASASIVLSEQHSAPNWTTEQKSDAKAKRDVEVRQLEARMGRLPLFSSSRDGISFNVPLQIPKPSRLPLSLQSLKESTLIVPQLYDLDPCRIKLKGVLGPEVENVELAFEKRATDQRDLTLMAHINYLTQNIHTMAASSEVVPIPTVEPAQPRASSTAVPVSMPLEQAEESVMQGRVDEDRPHLRFLSQPPPEWLRQPTDEESESETSDDYDSEEDSSDTSEGDKAATGGASLPTLAPVSALEKGILLSFPQLELHGVELLELRDISLSVKCDRCKDTMDIQNIKAADPSSLSIRTESCKKCAAPISVSFRPEPMHANSIRAGYLDLEGCSIVDMLPSHFLPTCAECSTTQPTPGIVAVRGESPVAVCRECHHKLNFKLPEVKFLRVSSNDPRLNLPLRSKRKKENLGITAGSELPERGRCKHYSKSYRWFRFSCCNRVYPCDRCHDEKEEHPNEHANRMICGWCSREQNYRPEDCNACGRSVIRKTGGGFWEGGKGTRDKNKMSRKDPRKYKRIGGGAK